MVHNDGRDGNDFKACLHTTKAGREDPCRRTDVGLQILVLIGYSVLEYALRVENRSTARLARILY
jgi:hypothetical protein